MTDASSLFVLNECAAGYGLFECVAFSEISSSPESITDIQRFSRMTKLKAFQPFSTAEEALENINAVSEHCMSSLLKSFLEMNLPKVSKKKKSTVVAALGILDSGLATAINEGLNNSIPVRSDDTIREIVRGIRLHLTFYLPSLLNGAIEQAQLGLGHSYSRAKVKFNPARSDNMIIQSIALLDTMDKDLNTFAMRVREWYSWHFPELKDLVKDNYMFARCVAFVQDKNTLCANKADVEDGDSGLVVEKLPGLIEIVGDDELAKSIVSAARTSMGMDCSVIDMINIINFTQRMVKLAEYRKQLSLYLTDKMHIVAPNLSALIGDTVGARLISKAGSLTNLAKAPASTIQILGAEKALFRALKTKGNTPKYGLIYHSTFIGRAGAKNKGRISRYLANKCSIATRIDSFSDNPCGAYGEKLKDQVEERLKFYETGAQPRKNLDVMMEVARSLANNVSESDDEMETPKKRKLDKSDDQVKSDKKAAKKSAKKAKKAAAETTPTKMDVASDSEEEKPDKKSAKKSSKKAKREEKEASTPIKMDMESAEDEVAMKSAKKSAKKSKKDEVSTPVKSKEDSEEKKSAKKSAKKSSKKKKKSSSD